VRPGNGFVPDFPLLKKADVNGYKAQPLYRFLRLSKPIQDDRDHEKDMEEPASEPIWARLYSPLTATDVIWNFEKFLVDKKGVVRHRYVPAAAPEDLVGTIEKLLAE
jgi:glutathione peroxidase